MEPTTCDLKPIGKAEAYRILRELVLRMDLACKTAAECKGLEALAAEYRWQHATDHVLRAVELLK